MGRGRATRRLDWLGCNEWGEESWVELRCGVQAHGMGLTWKECTAGRHVDRERQVCFVVG